MIVTTLGAPAMGAERRSWNKIRYIGGTVDVKTSSFDWNTTITVSTNPGTLSVSIAPGKPFRPVEKISIDPSRVVSLSTGSAAWRRVSEVSGAQLPSKAPSLFGVLDDNGYMAIVWETGSGKREAMLMESRFSWRILGALKAISGRDIDGP